MPMSALWRRALWILLALVLVVSFTLSLSARFLTDWFWFESLGYGAAFWRPWQWVWAMRIGVGLLLALFYYLNFRITRPVVARAMFQLQAAFPPSLRWGAVNALFAAASLLLGFLSSAAVALYWERIAAYVHRVNAVGVDPLFGRPIGFYLFELPLWELVQSTASGVLVVAALVAAGIYIVTRSLHLSESGLQADPRARRHLAALGMGLLLMKAWGYRLAIFGLVYGQTGVIYGAGYTDTHARLPALWILFGLALLAAALLAFNLLREALLPAAGAVAGLMAASLVVGVGYPAALEQLVVAPNELERQRPYIEDHVRMTRQAFGLDQIQETDFASPAALTQAIAGRNRVTMENIRLWDWRPLLRTYAQLQEIRLYYDFHDVDVDRYQVGGELRQVMLSAREMSAGSLQNPTWINQHLQYTHGYGLVMSPVNEVTPEGMPDFFIKNLPPESPVGMEVTRPEVYYGEKTDDYVIVKTLTPEFDYPQGDDNALTTYQGSGGVPLSDPLRRALFALRLGTAKVLLSRDITSESRVMLYRNIQERVQRIAPFLRYDPDPYLVLSDGRLFWMQDAYTTTNAYPYSLPVRGWGNYARNAVKVVTDAYNGSVWFYVADPADPLIQVYQKIYPGLFTPISAMPADLFAHRRYPEDLFRLQSRLYTVYHMENPTVFYNREDSWSIPKEIYGSQEVEVEPYYVVMRLPGGTAEEMVLMTPFTPSRKDNMVAWMAARNDGDAYGKLLVYKFPKQSLTFGPMQIESRINQDASISQLLSLWNQQGTSVIRGNLLVVPVENAILYAEPLYLQARQSELPELKRVIVASGSRLTIAPTLVEAVAELVNPSGRVDPELGLAGAAAAVGRGQPGGSTGSAAELSRRAAEQFDEAQSRLRAGDWAAYGRAIDELGRTLRELARQAPSGE